MMRRAAHSCSARRSAQVPSRAQPSCPTRSRRPMTRPPQEPAPPIRTRAARGSAHAATVTAFTERLVPGAAGKPGARDADVLNYIDLALAGAYADLQYFYRRGLAS